MLPAQTTALVIGAGPTGVAATISLLKAGCKDVVLVDASPARSVFTSRAMAIHAATLEALESIGCADQMANRGIQSQGVTVCDRKSQLLTPGFTTLAPYTKYPYVLFLPQHITEEILEQTLENMGTKVIRSHKVVSLQDSGVEGVTSVHFENGSVINARYIIGADGARSTVRQLSGINFTDPDGEASDTENAAPQMVLADVVFNTTSPALPVDTAYSVMCSEGFILCFPLPKPLEGDETPYRIAFNLPLSQATPPSHPTTELIQEYLNKRGPFGLSSDPSVNPSPIHITKTIWSTRFRTHSAVADTFTTILKTESGKEGAHVFLVGDAAHVHSPAGGQGMNLGLRDAIGLSAVLTRHVEGDSTALEEYAKERHERALTTIRLTKRVMGIFTALSTPGVFGGLQAAVVCFFGSLPFVKRMSAWQLSGLGNR
ncbi:FAD/NAD(P)-binding domain-containing protein [Pluteus cervinus]|uniref:FAD/NAD(P)-binding domain-containing protein n=1 Tax=Pluteus cervinus TaxID=181527 RepID=A0ACD3B638_9AGAR|nr:FAD/NAD(P)-binding domain-containing protein [Pluteus cervinus]